MFASASRLPVALANAGTSAVQSLRRAAIIATVLVAAWCALDVRAEPGGAGLPPTLAGAGLTEEQWRLVVAEVAVHSRRAGVTEVSLIAAAEAAGATLSRSGRFDALSLQQIIIERLAERADQIAELRQKLGELVGESDAEAAALLLQARIALDEGRIADTDQILAALVLRDLETMRDADAEAERRRLRAGESIASRGRIAFIQADFVTAATHFERAALTVPDRQTQARWGHLHNLGVALSAQGELFAEPHRLQEAIRALRASLPLASADGQAGRTYSELAYACIRLADLGNASELASAADAIGAAERTSFASEARESALLRGLAGRLAFLEYRHGDQSALIRAIRAYEQALSLLDDNSSAELRARLTISLTETYLEWGKALGDDTLIVTAIAQARLVVDGGAPPVSDRAAGYAHMLLGVAYIERMQLTGFGSFDFAPLSELAAAHLARAERIFGDSAGALYWASVQNNIGRFYELACLHEAYWNQDPRPQCEAALARYERALAALPQTSATSRRIEENIRGLRAILVELD